jgi:hypothetical protein
MRVVGILACFAIACAHNVPQDKATSPDGRIKGAKVLTFDNDVASDTGIVTYPGGDRIDWKAIEIPDKRKGKLDITLAWTPPRPGLRLGFQVFDQFQQLITSTKKGTGRTRVASVDNAKGKYFIRVYALGRGDAGKYKLDVEFHDGGGGPVGIEWLKVDVPEPPKLADLPTVVDGGKPCDKYTFDKTNRNCENVCPFPIQDPPEGWKACENVCTKKNPVAEDAAKPACAKIMKCDRRAPDNRIPDCTGKFPPCDFTKDPLDTDNPNCLKPRPPVYAYIKGNRIDGGDLEVTMIVMDKATITTKWSASIIKGGSENARPAADIPLSGGRLDITRVDGNVVKARGKLTIDQLKDNKWVKLQAP